MSKNQHKYNKNYNLYINLAYKQQRSLDVANFT